jgi:hypothetical protein
MEVGEAGPSLKSFDGESRVLSRLGWLYFRDSQHRCYRVRRIESAPVISPGN